VEKFRQRYSKTGAATKTGTPASKESAKA